jgi:hypothetical protein
MNLVFLHGRPATGKLTIARKLVTLTGYQLYHNHVAVDEALQLYAFGTPGFIQRREQLWREFFVRAARQLPPGVIFTFSPENTVPQSFIDWLFGEWSASGIQLLSVELLASETAIEARLGASQRKHFKKITERVLYRELKNRGAFDSPLIPRSDLRINTEKNSPDEAARAIVAHFNLNEPTI